ncbi:MAG: hypothetical protein ACFFA5_01475 [Promethearchaeota archaeon]
MIDSQILGNNNLGYHEFSVALSQFYSAVENVKECLTMPSQFTSSSGRKSFSIKFPILRLYPLFEKVAKYRSKFPELSLHEVVLAWQTVFWMAEHHQLDTIFKYFFKAYEKLKEFYESFNK